MSHLYNPSYEEVLKRLMKKARETDKLVEKEKAVRFFVGKIKKEHAENVEDIILYGSYARGEADAESDVDALIVWNGSLPEGREQMAELATEALLEHDVIVPPKVVSPKNYEEMKKSRLPFMENVRQEGIKLG